MKILRKILYSKLFKTKVISIYNHILCEVSMSHNHIYSCACVVKSLTLVYKDNKEMNEERKGHSVLSIFDWQFCVQSLLISATECTDFIG